MNAFERSITVLFCGCSGGAVATINLCRAITYMVRGIISDQKIPIRFTIIERNQQLCDEGILNIYE